MKRFREKYLAHTGTRLIRGNSQGGDVDCKSTAFAQGGSIPSPRTEMMWHDIVFSLAI